MGKARIARLMVVLVVLSIGFAMLSYSVVGLCQYQEKIYEKYECKLAYEDCKTRKLTATSLETLVVKTGTAPTTTTIVRSDAQLVQGAVETLIKYSGDSTGSCFYNEADSYVSITAGGGWYDTIIRTSIQGGGAWDPSPGISCSGSNPNCPVGTLYCPSAVSGWQCYKGTHYFAPGLNLDSNSLVLECLDATAQSACATDFDIDGFLDNVMIEGSMDCDSTISDDPLGCSGTFTCDSSHSKCAKCINRQAAEYCDGIDNDCDGQIDEALTTSTGCTQLGVCSGAVKTCTAGSWGACSKLPATEICDNIDNDCDGTADEGCDDDDDKYCDTSMELTNVVTVTGGICEYENDDALIGTDCNDNKNNVYPGATEICDFVDNNCISGIDEGFDTDNDGFKTCENDCDDTNHDINPDVVEKCNGIDDNCDAEVDKGCDDDNDNYCDTSMDLTNAVTGAGGICKNEADDAVMGTDCNDKKNNVYPGADELCDAYDNNCNTKVNGVDELLESEKPCTLKFIFMPLTFNVINIDTKNIMAYTWDFGDGSVFGTSYADEALPVTHTYISADTYTVKFRMMSIINHEFKIYETKMKVAIDLSEKDGICTKDSDCQTDYCNPNGRCSVPSCIDDEDIWQNQEETDVNCGGPNCEEKCDLSKNCSENSDCLSYNCLDKKCWFVENSCTISDSCSEGLGENCIFSINDDHIVNTGCEGENADFYKVCCNDFSRATSGGVSLGLNPDISISGATSCSISNHGCSAEETCIAGVSSDRSEAWLCENYLDKVCCSAG